MPTILGANTLSAAYDVDNSTMFESNDSSYFSKEYSSAASENKIFTVSTWVKKSKLGAVD